MLLRSSVRSSRWLAALVLGVAPALLSGSLGGSALAPLVEGQAARAQELGPTSGERLLDEAVDHTHRNWWDRANRDKIDWKGLKDKYRPAIRAAATPRDAHHVVNDLFSELKTSHLVLMEGPAYERELQSEFQAKPTPRACFELVALPSGHFVSGILEGSPAAKAGLRDGDEVVSIDGAPTGDCPLLEEAGHDPGIPGPHGYLLKIPANPEPLALGVRRKKGGPVEEVRFVPSAYSMLEAAKSSVRVVEQGDRKLGVVHLWHFMTPAMNGVLTDALKGPLAGCDGLVLDVRGRGGLANVVWQVIGQFQGPRAIWKKPVIVLQDRGTRSAKEIFAWAWKPRNLGKIVGERTAGAVIGCQFKKLFDGSWLLYPAVDVRNLTKGENLEGNGIEPDVAVDQAPLEFRAGRDTILERGKAVILEEIKARTRMRFF